ncbi:hypothetical protein EUX98_g9139 [Antrodiella citrinella]|uniref:Uncharacterized protein n=1 Tax=Antrodiella citrinella TaxID=2447956 RepID=A0A4S4LXN8_9APHY|nr:hypothetical protein EUX98_g9139 [Antrodiella citrinella]
MSPDPITDIIQFAVRAKDGGLHLWNSVFMAYITFPIWLLHEYRIFDLVLRSSLGFRRTEHRIPAGYDDFLICMNVVLKKVPWGWTSVTYSSGAICISGEPMPGHILCPPLPTVFSPEKVDHYNDLVFAASTRQLIHDRRQMGTDPRPRRTSNLYPTPARRAGRQVTFKDELSQASASGDQSLLDESRAIEEMMTKIWKPVGHGSGRRKDTPYPTATTYATPSSSSDATITPPGSPTPTPTPAPLTIITSTPMSGAAAVVANSIVQPIPSAPRATVSHAYSKTRSGAAMMDVSV